MYEWLIMAFPKGMATLDQCKLAVISTIAKRKITPEQFKEITGEDYIA